MSLTDTSRARSVLNYKGMARVGWLPFLLVLLSSYINKNKSHKVLKRVYTVDVISTLAAMCRPRSIATTLCLTISFYYLSIIKYQLYSYII